MQMGGNELNTQHILLQGLPNINSHRSGGYNSLSRLLILSLSLCQMKYHYSSGNRENQTLWIFILLLLGCQFSTKSNTIPNFFQSTKGMR